MHKAATLFCLLLACAGCANARDTRMSEGAAIGGAGGAVIAGPVGLVVGGLAGAVTADTTRPRGGAKSCHYDTVLEKNVCSYE